jgi:hypothetical protein
MPLVSYFNGIQVYMYYHEHGTAHFHVYYQEFKASIDIESGKILRGSLPLPAQRQLEGWRKLHYDALMRNWRLARFGEPLKAIPGAQS